MNVRIKFLLPSEKKNALKYASIHILIITFIIYIKEKNTEVTQTYQTITKHTQHGNKLLIYIITLIYKYILYNYYYYTHRKI